MGSAAAWAGWVMALPKFWLGGHNVFGPTNNWPVCSLILHCGQLILRKISKIGASRYQLQFLRLKCTKLTFCWGSAPDPAGELTVPPYPFLYLRGLLLRGWRETGDGEEKVKGKEGERWREGFDPPKNFCLAPPTPVYSVSTLLEHCTVLLYCTVFVFE